MTGWASCCLAIDGTKNEENHFWCERCSEDLMEFRQKPENRALKLPEDFDSKDPKATEAFMRLRQKIQDREAAFMRQKLAERKGPNNTM